MVRDCCTRLVVHIGIQCCVGVHQGLHFSTYRCTNRHITVSQYRIDRFNQSIRTADQQLRIDSRIRCGILNWVCAVALKAINRLRKTIDQSLQIRHIGNACLLIATHRSIQYGQQVRFVSARDPKNCVIRHLRLMVSCLRILHIRQEILKGRYQGLNTTDLTNLYTPHTRTIQRCANRSDFTFTKVRVAQRRKVQRCDV